MDELHFAAGDKKNGYLKVKQLIEEMPLETRHGYVNHIHPDHLTRPVEWAAQSGSLKTLKYLIEIEKVDLDASHSNHNLLYWALENTEDIIDYVSQPSIIEQFKDGTTDLHAAAASGKLEQVKKLIKRSKRINEKNIRGETPLFWAVKANRNEIIDFIAHHPAFKSVPEKIKWDPLHRHFAKKHFSRANQYYEVNKPNRALHAYKKTISRFKRMSRFADDDLETLSNCSMKLSDLYLVKKMDKSALSAATEAISYARLIKLACHSNRCQAEAYHFLGLIYDQLKKKDEAVYAFNRAIEVGSERYKELPMYANSLYTIYLQKNNITEAIRVALMEIDFLKNLKPQTLEETNDQYQRIGMAHDNLARLYCQSSCESTVIIDMQRCGIDWLEKINPKQDKDIINLAKSYKRLGLYYIREHNQNHHSVISTLKKSICLCEQIEHTYTRHHLLTKHQNLLEICEKYLASTKHKIMLEEEAKAYGFECSDTPANGDCFFSAVEQQLSIHAPDLFHPAYDLRAKTVGHIEHYFSEYRGFVEEPDSYLERLRKSGTWADDVSIRALSRVLNVTLAIINSDGTPPIIIKRPHPRATLYLGYEIDCHYQSLIRRADWQAVKNLPFETAPIDNFIVLDENSSSEKKRNYEDDDLPISKIYRSSQTFFEKPLAPQSDPLNDDKKPMQCVTYH